MDSMKRGEANISHHPKKVVTNNLVTDSNKVSTSSSNNSTKTKTQQESLSKQETNFEDYDNEWDVGIGDLIIDLDADIEKSTQQNSQSSSSSSSNSTTSLQSTPLPKVTNNNNNNNNNHHHHNKSSSKDPLAIPKTLIAKSVTKLEQVSKLQAANIAGKDQKKISGGTSTVSTSGATGASSSATKSSSKVSVNDTGSSGNTKIATTTKHHHHSHHHKSSGNSSGNNNNNSSAGNSVSLSGGSSNNTSVKSSETPSSILATGAGTASEKMSSTSGTSTNSKSAGKLTAAATTVVDHQATLDKGLKMKIKRTKPGTKTSEAKHEIVKAEQNGAASGLDSDTNSSSGGSSSGKKQHNTLPVTPSGTPIVTPVTPNTPTVTATTPQSNKRGSSSHRRDKQKDKKDKGDHSSTNASSGTTNTQNSCSCSSDTIVNGVASLTCSSSTCKNRPDSLSLRLSGNLGLNSSGSNSFAGGLVTPNSLIKDKISSSATLSQQQQQQPAASINTIPSTTTTSSNNNNTNNNASSNNIINNKSNTSTLISTTSNNVLQSGRENAFSKSLSQVNSLYGSTTGDDKSGRCVSPPLKRIKCETNSEMVDACVGTSVGTITEPDCLGPCEPGTSVTLEGIVWHETEGGVLVVNVTWRGKTYVGTLLDCTRHDWAPPRLCDSPTEDLDSRTPKGRETRSSVNSKLRNGGKTGRGGRTSTTGSTTTTTSSSSSTTSSNSSSGGTSTTNSSNTPSPSPNTGAFLPPRPEKRKSKDESPSPVNGNVSGGTGGSSAAGQNSVAASGATTQSVVNPVTGQNVQISTKKCKTASPCAVSPVLLECPEQDCSKKYKHANGLRYHQSHAHGSISSMDEDSSHSQLPESPRLNPPSTPSSPGLDKAITTNSSNNSTTTPTPATTTTNNTTTSQNNATNLSAPDTPTKPPDLAATTPLQGTQGSSPLVDGPAGASVVGGSITTGVAGQPTNTLPTPPSDTKPLGSPLRPGDLTLKAKSSILRYHHGEIPSQHTIDAIATSHHASAGNGALNLIERPLSLQQQQQPIPMMTQHHHSQQQQQQQHGGTLSALSASLNAAPMQMRPISGLLGPSSGQICANQAHITDLSVQNPALLKGPSGFTKPNSKKNRKSPVPNDFDNSINRDDVQSPAYSDISDDSTPQIVDGEDKSKNIPANSDGVVSLTGKKPNESPGGPASLGGPLGGFGMYPMYPNMPPYYPPGHPDAGKPIPISQSPSSMGIGGRDPKDNAPPLDLINKPLQVQQQNNSDNNGNNNPQTLLPGKDSLQTNIPPQQTGQVPGPPGKLPQHYFPLGYPLSYPFNMDPAYGPVSMMSDAEKMRAMAVAEAVNIKEERNKESSSPNDHPKSGTQQSLQGKIIKSEPLSLKDIKTEVGHSGAPMHPMYQRHSLGPPPHLAREEEIRRYYAQFSPNQRRSSHPGGPPSSHSGPKDDSPSGSGSQMGPSSSGPPPTGAQSLQSMQQASKNLKSSMLSQSPQQKPSNLSSKDSDRSDRKSSGMSKEDQDMPKVKQEGQKPTMETQGPPPPPTSQFYLHPSFASPYPFEPIYRNMLVSSPFNAPAYHLPMARIPPPEDLSRNPNTKALDLLQHHANQYYNSHKIHELSEHGINVNDRSLKSPTSNVKVSVSSPSLTPQGGQQSSNNAVERPIPPSPNHPSVVGSLGPSPGPQNMSAVVGGGGGGQSQSQSKNLEKPHNETAVGKSGGDGPAGSELKDNGGSGGGRSPPPQRHVHTHHHTHVGLGYPMYPAPYGAAAVLASQQAAAVAVINPYPPPPTK